MERILVTGGAGFIGSNLVEKLKSLGYDIIVIDNYSTGKVENHIDGVKYINGCTVNIEDIMKGKEIDVVFHLAEYSRIVSSFTDISTVWKSNSLGTWNVLEFCKKRNIKIIYSGSSTRFALEGVLHSPYAFTKSKSAELIKGYKIWYNLKYAICYFYNVFGNRYDSKHIPGEESVISVFEKQYKANKPLTICGNGHQRRSFTYVDDIVDGLIKAWKYKYNEEFQLNNPNGYSILEIANMFCDNIKHIAPRPGDRATSITTNNNARELLNWKTTIDITEWIEKIKH